MLTSRKSQTNLIIILAMVIALFWALMNQFYYTSSIGLSTTMRKEMANLLFEAERARVVYDQERKYALDRALLFTGLSGGNTTDECGYLWVNESFPFIPVPELYLERPKITYWKNEDLSCIPSTQTIIDTTSNILRDYFSFAKISALTHSGEISSEIQVELHRNDHPIKGLIYEGILEQPYLRDAYNLEYYEYSEEVAEDTFIYYQAVNFTGDKYGIFASAKVGESAVIENIWFQLIGFSPVKIQLDNKPYVNPITGFRNQANCILFGDNYYLFASNYTPSTGLYKFYVFDDGETCYAHPDEYRTLQEPNQDDLIAILSKVGDTVDIEGDVYEVAALHEVDGEYIHLLPQNTRMFNIAKDWVHYSSQLNAYEFGGEVCSTPKKTSPYYADCADACRGGDPHDISDCIDDCLIAAGCEEDALRQGYCTCDISDLKIGGNTPSRGEITYTFIPSQNEQLCFSVEQQKFQIDNCVNLLSKTTYSGGFADLYSYAKEYLEGEYGKFEGWQRYELDHRLDYILDSVTMITLKVFDGSDVIPKQDWKSRLIWNLGLEGTEYSYAHLDSCAKSLVAGDVEVFDCTACEGLEVDCDALLGAAIEAEFKREFEQITPTKLEYLTTYPWIIKVKDFRVNVSDKCSGEWFVTQYEQSYDFEPMGQSQVIGLPLQLLFGYEDSIIIESPYSGCPCSENPNIPGVSCDLNLDCNCGVNDTVGMLECNPRGHCCPQGYVDVDTGIFKTAYFDESLIINETLYPCCVKTVEGGTFADSVYYCYKKGTTTAVKIGIDESIQDPDEGGGTYTGGGGRTILR